MPLSAWNIWLHPRISAREMNSLETQAALADELRAELSRLSVYSAETDERLARSEAECATLRKNNDKLNEEVRKLAQRLQAATEELEDTKKSLDAANTELSYRRDTETQLSEFEKTLERVEMMKANYEKRIHALREMVKNLKEKIDENEGFSSELSIIDMTTPDARQPGPTSHSMPGTSESGLESEDDWLQPLPDL